MKYSQSTARSGDIRPSTKRENRALSKDFLEDSVGISQEGGVGSRVPRQWVRLSEERGAEAWRQPCYAPRWSTDLGLRILLFMLHP